MSFESTMIRLVPADGCEIGAFRVAPPQPLGGLVLLQEIFGVNSHIRSVAAAFAALGYGVIAPALFDRVESDVQLGYSPPDIERGKAIRQKVADEPALLDIDAAIKEAASFGKVGIVGYCWGGRMAWLASARCSGLSKAVSYYPGGIGALLQEQPKSTVLLHFGRNDATIPLADVEALRSQHPKAIIHLYEAGHGFSCDARPSFHHASHALAFERTKDFLKSLRG